MGPLTNWDSEIEADAENGRLEAMHQRLQSEVGDGLGEQPLEDHIERQSARERMVRLDVELGQTQFKLRELNIKLLTAKRQLFGLCFQADSKLGDYGISLEQAVLWTFSCYKVQIAPDVLIEKLSKLGFDIKLTRDYRVYNILRKLCKTGLLKRTQVGIGRRQAKYVYVRPQT